MARFLKKAIEYGSQKTAGHLSHRCITNKSLEQSLPIVTLLLCVKPNTGAVQKV